LNDLPIRSINTAKMTTTRSGQPRKKRGQGEQRREEILLAAQKLFIRDGADRTTMRAIGDEVGISSAAVYAYFPDKMAVYVAVAEAAFKKLGALFAEASALPTPLERLRAMMKSYVHFGLAHPEAYEIAFAPNMVFRPGPSTFTPPSLAVSAGTQAFDAFHKALLEVPSIGDQANVTDDRLARVIWATGHGIVSLSRSKADALPLDADVYVDALLDALLQRS
jgi:AcrR family transcriptional regulator